MENSIPYDEQDYLGLNPDVAAAVKKGTFVNGWDHFVRYGQAEGRTCYIPDKLSHYIDNTNPGWSGHLTLPGYTEKPRIPTQGLNIVNVPDEFKPVQNVVYPEGNTMPFERYFEKCFVEDSPNTYRKFLPIHWCAFYVNANYGTDKKAIKKLQDFIDTLPKNEKYFSLTQYDDGILNDISGLDILVYSMGNNTPGFYPVPLICVPTCAQPFEMPKKDILYSFIGADTHPIRKQLVKELKSKWVRFGAMPHNEYINELKRSIFCLSPRGFGCTSFRLYESLAYGCIPLYISDSHWEAFNIPFTEYGLKIYPDQIKDMPEIIKTVDIPKMQAKVKEVFESYFTYSSCYESIIKTLN